jgi:uncharacterized protein YbbK (DUF523 family)
LSRSNLIIVSACLAGERCRFDGTDCGVPEIIELVRGGRAVGACPECLGGLGVPRPAAEIVGGDGRDVLAGKAAVLTDKGDDVTGPFIAGAHLMVELAEATGCRRAMLKSKSPSCAADGIFDGTFSGKMRPGLGVAAAVLAEAGILIEYTK